jgi:hypothetical protein
MEPGLSSPAAFRRLLVRPPGQLATRIKVFEAENANEKARLVGGLPVVSMFTFAYAPER